MTEDIIYTGMLAVHILAAVGCAAGPFYQLRMVNKRAGNFSISVGKNTEIKS